jgi:predicted small lipoprotein YifL
MRLLGRSALIVGLSLMTAACGRKGPLIYPDMLVPAAPAAVTALQSGSSVKLQLTLPDKDRGGRPLQGMAVAGVKISRRAAETGLKDVCRSCMTDYRLFQTLYLDHLPAAAQRLGSRLVVLDGDVSSGNSYSYSIVPFTADGIDGSSSPTVDVRMVPSLPAPALKAESFPTEIKLQFSIQALISGRLLGYNLYRSSGAGTRSYLPLNAEPLQGNEYVDRTLERGVKYRYSARALIMPETEDIAESAESDGVEGMLKDDE